MDDELVLDVDGNPVAPLEDQLALLLESGLVPEFIPAGDCTENNGDEPKTFVLF